MKKIPLFCIILAFIMAFSSCSLIESVNDRRLQDTDNDAINGVFGDFLTTLGNKNKDGMKKLFSKPARDNDTDLDSMIDQLFESYKGKLKSYGLVKGPTVSSSFSYGDETENMQAAYFVETTESYYHFLIDCVTEDTVNPDNIGITSLHVKKGRADETDGINWGDIDNEYGLILRRMDDII
ncbi:MAG: DUF5104 domain-containing protein [Clostridia bacterium]|nr:DUF5104 domain-containing protein [Clostridia bacterium]